MRIAAMVATLVTWPWAVVLVDGHWDEKAIWLGLTPVAAGIAYWLAGLLHR